MPQKQNIQISKLLPPTVGEGKSEKLKLPQTKSPHWISKWIRSSIPIISPMSTKLAERFSKAYLNFKTVSVIWLAFFRIQWLHKANADQETQSHKYGLSFNAANPLGWWKRETASFERSEGSHLGEACNIPLSCRVALESLKVEKHWIEACASSFSFISPGFIN